MKGQSPARLLLISAAVLSLSSCRRASEQLLVPPSETFAELRAVRHGVSVAPPRGPEREPFAHERLADGEAITIRSGGLAWLRRDAGATLLLAGPASLTLRATAIEVREGKLFVDTSTSAAADVTTSRGSFHLSKVRASLEVRKDGVVEIYVLRGAVSCGADVEVHPGEMATLRPDGTSRKASAIAWEDWTGGLATTDPAAEPAPFGVGTIGARRPGDQGQPRFALSIQRLDVTVTVDHDLATTEVDEVFSNPTSETVEGMYSFRTPPGATLSRFGVDRKRHLVWGRIKEKQAARAQYQANVYQGSTEDPALLEWDSPGVYKARLYPIAPGATRRVVTRYSEWLGREGDRGQRRLYVYPMAAEGVESTLPRIEELTINLDFSRSGAREVRAGMQAKRSGERMSVKAFDYVPRADFALELLDGGMDGVVAYRSGHAIEPELLDSDALPRALADAKHESDYLLVPLRAGHSSTPSAGLDLAVVVDTSAATDRASLALARAMTGALLAHLGPDDRAAVFAGDATLRPVVEGSDVLAKVDDTRREAIANGLSRIDRGGATDLGTMIVDAASKVDPTRRSAVVYIGDGKPTVGELALPTLRERLMRVPHPVRIFGIGVGDDADLAMIKGIASGGSVERVTDGFGAARAALRLLEEADRPVWIGAQVDLGTGIERVFPRQIGVLPADQTVLAVGRVRGDLPKQIVVRGAGGETIEKTRIVRLDDGGDLRRRWAEQRLAQLLEDGAGRAAVAEIGVRAGIITPYTSFYVLTEAEYDADEAKHQFDGVAAARTGGGRGFFGWLRPRAVGYGAVAASAEMADAKEGGTGTRAKGEEGSMGNAQVRADGERQQAPAAPFATAAAPAAASALALAEVPAGGMQKKAPARPADAPAEAPPPPPVANRDVDEVVRSGGFGSGLAAIGGRGSPGAAKPVPATRRASPSAAQAVRDDGRAHLGDPLNQPEITTLGALGGPGVAAPAGLNFGTGSGGGGVMKAAATTGSPRAAGSLAGSKGKSSIVEDGAGRTSPIAPTRPVYAFVSTTVGIIGIASHERQTCSNASTLPLDERRILWIERLAPVAKNPTGILGVYDRALAGCEASTWRERQQLLLLMVNAAGSIAQQVELWRALVVHPQAADIVYRAIVTRVHSAAELREFSDALGLKKLDPGLLVQALSTAKTKDGLVAKLKELTLAWPDDFELALKLLEAYEDVGDLGAGRALARYLRARLDANTRVRTEVGEYYLRLASGRVGGSGNTAGAGVDPTKVATGMADVDPTAAATDTAEARRTFGEIVEFSPEDPVARRRLGDLLCAHGWYDEAFRQYQTLAQLSPDDTSVPMLLANAAQGMGKTEEAIRWIEKAAASTAADADAASARTARSLASAFLAWAREEAQRAGRTEESDRLRERARRFATRDAANSGTARVVLTWSHPELHVQLWASALGPPMLARDGDPLLGVAQVVLPATEGATAELHLSQEDEALARRLRLSAVLTTIIDEGSADERIDRTVVSFGTVRAPREGRGAERAKGEKRGGLASALGIGAEPNGADVVARRFRVENRSLVEEVL